MKNSITLGRSLTNKLKARASPMLNIDADAHVLETEKTWESLDGAQRKFRPQVVGSTDASSSDEYWLVDGLKPGIGEKIVDDNARALHAL